MNAERFLVFFVFAVVAWRAAAANWEFAYKPAESSYSVYGNSLGDPVAPADKDKKIAFEVRNAAAREIFEAIGPDKKDECASEPGMRFRSRDDDKISCLKSAKGEYVCYFGFDLVSGKSIGGSIC